MKGLNENQIVYNNSSMKRTGMFILLLIVVLSLFACGNDDSKDKEEFNPVGTWATSFEITETEAGNQKGDIITWTFYNYEGGSGKFTITNSRTPLQNGEFNTTWEMKDEVVNITYSSITMGFRVDKDNDTLNPVDGSSKVLKRQ